MSTKYPGGLITKTPVTPTGPYESGAAPGVWTVEQALQYTKQGIWPTAGNQDPANLYIEYLFSTYLYTGNGSTQTITNGINLSGKGGLVWTKDRTSAIGNELTDTVRGAGLRLISNNATAQGGAGSSDTTSFTTTGFGLTYNNGGGNLTGENYVSWTFREQAKFFDIVTYTGNGLSSQVISHNLGSVPGCIIVKNMTSGARDWEVFHTSLGATKSIQLNLTSAATTSIDYWNNTAPTSTQFTVGGNNTVNTDTHNYVAYIFAHNAGGFGASGTDNVISCGSFTADNAGGGAYAGGATVNLGYEPQFVMFKETDSTLSDPNWIMVDTFRGYRAQQTSGSDIGQQRLRANTDEAEANAGGCSFPTSTGFSALQLTGGATYIYIAIRRGPMKTPTVGTSVFTPATRTGTGTAVTTTSAGFPVDMLLTPLRTGVDANGRVIVDRLRGGTKSTLWTQQTTASQDYGTNVVFDAMTGIKFGSDGAGTTVNQSGNTHVDYMFRRAPGFFDEVCYIGTGANTTVTHNLGVVPEMMIVRYRSGAEDWGVYTAATGNTGSLRLNTTGSFIVQSVVWNNTTPTASVFSIGSNSMVNNNAGTYVAYLFATLAGVSKVGGYTGTGAAQTINCGFTTGARFVLIKRSDSTGDWYVWDSARGIIPSNDPYLLLNSTAAEVTGTDYVDTTSVGFDITSTAPAGINANGGTFIFLAIA